MYKRIFTSFEELEWLNIHKPHGCIVRHTCTEYTPHDFVIEGPSNMSRRINEFVETFDVDQN